MKEYFCSFYGTVTNGSQSFVEQCLCCSLGKMTDEEFGRFMRLTAESREVYGDMLMGNVVIHHNTREGQDRALAKFEKNETNTVRKLLLYFQAFADSIRVSRSSAPTVIHCPAPSEPLYILAARKKTKKETQPDGKTTFRAILQDEGEWKCKPEETIIKGIDPDVQEALKKLLPSKKDIADAVFDGAFRAQARFASENDFDETPIEKIHRLRCDNVKWKPIVREIYNDEHGENIDESLLPAEVKRWQKKHRGGYPHFYTK